MKKRFCTAVIVTSILLAPIFVACTQSANESKVSQKQEEVIKEVKIASNPSKLSYKEGEKFSTSGFKLTVIYESGEEATVRTGFEVDKKSPLTKDDTKVTITWGEYKFEFDITVITVTLTEFKLKSALTVNTYAEKSEVDLSGLVFVASYDDETEKELTLESEGVEIKVDENKTFVNKSLGSTLGAGKHEFTVSYGGKSAKFELEIVSGYKIEAEKMMNNPDLTTVDSYIMAKLSASDAEYQPGKELKDTGDGGITPIKEANASGGGFLGGLKAGNVIEFYFKSDVETTAQIEIAASSNWVKGIVNNNPTWVADMQLNEVMSAKTIDANGKETNVVIADTVILEGSGSPDNTEGDKKFYRNFKKVEFGTMEVKVGWNRVVIAYKTSDELGQLPVDSDTGKPKYQNTHNNNYGVPAIDYLQIKMN